MIHFPADEGVDETTEAASQQATWLAGILSPEFEPVADPDGGVVFTRLTATGDEVFHAWGDGSLEYYRAEGSRLVERRTITRG